MDSAIAHDLQAGKERTSDVAASAVTFEQLNLDNHFVRGLHAHKFVTPTKIQAAAIPMAIAGMDLMVQSKSGTGKTLIYVLAALNRMKFTKDVKTLIIVPTRELAIQVEDTANGIFSFSGHKICTVSFIGGTDVKKDRQRLRAGRIVVGTPGRLLHLILNKVLNPLHINLLVLDEADQLFGAESLYKDVQALIKQLPAERQIIACSATYPDGLDERLAKLMRRPVLVSNSERATVLLGIRQFVCELPEQLNSMQEMLAKLLAVHKIISQLPYEQAILFASSQSRADSFCSYLQRDGVDCHLMSGAMKQSERLETFQAYRNFKSRTMVATDLMARGVDSAHANLIINLDPPKDHVTYLHRIGRAGRFGSQGIAITFITSAEQGSQFKRILDKAGTGMSVLQFPAEKREGFDFWKFDAYDFPYYHKVEGCEQEEAALKRIRQRWKSDSDTEMAKTAAADNKTVNDAHDATVAKEIVTETAATSAECYKSTQSTDIKCLENKENLNDKQCEPIKTQIHKAALTEHNIQDMQRLKHIEKSPESHIEIVELTPSLDLPAAAPNSINTKTYCLAEPTEHSTTTLQPLAISNTVDDASSIVSDSMDNEYESDASYASYYTQSDARRVLGRALVQQKLQKRYQQQLAKRRVLVFNWRRTHALSSKRAALKLDYDSEEQTLEQPTNQAWIDEKDKPAPLLKEKTHKIHVDNKSFDMHIYPLPISQQLQHMRLLEKFDNFPKVQQQLKAYITKLNLNNLQAQKCLQQLYEAMQHLYYVDHSKCKSKKKQRLPLPEVPNLNTYHKFMEFLKQQQCDDEIAVQHQQQPVRQSLSKLSVHVNEQLNISPYIAVAAANHMEEAASVSSRSAAGSPALYEHEHADSDSLEPNSSSGFAESTESGSSGIDTSQYDSNSNTSTALDSDDYEEGEEEAFSASIAGTVSDEDSLSQSTLTAATDDDTEDQADSEETADDAEDAAAAQLALAQARWQQMFRMQYQFIANYVDNFMANSRRDDDA